MNGGMAILPVSSLGPCLDIAPLGSPWPIAALDSPACMLGGCAAVVGAAGLSLPPSRSLSADPKPAVCKYCGVAAAVPESCATSTDIALSARGAFTAGLVAPEWAPRIGSRPPMETDSSSCEACSASSSTMIFPASMPVPGPSTGCAECPAAACCCSGTFSPGVVLAPRLPAAAVVTAWWEVASLSSWGAAACRAWACSVGLCSLAPSRGLWAMGRMLGMGLLCRIPSC